MTVRLLSRANRELAEAAEFYLQEAGVRIADRFLDEVKASSVNIGMDPARYPLHHGNTRVVRLLTFPYSIYFRVTPQEIIVVAISHDSRRPNYWRDK